MNINLPLGQKILVAINDPMDHPTVTVTSGEAATEITEKGVIITPTKEGIVIVEITWDHDGENVILTVDKDVIPSVEVDTLQLSFLP